MSPVEPEDPPITRRDPNRREWHLEEDLLVIDGNTRFTIPSGTTSDLASIPRALWWVLDDTELGIAPTFVHDYLYRRGGKVEGEHFSRKGADALFFDLMIEEGVSERRAVLTHLAVRLFGRGAWRRT